MNAMTRWDPFRELDDLQNRLSTLFGRAPVRKDGPKDEALNGGRMGAVSRHCGGPSVLD
jgi:hypothetical protein